MTDITDEMIAKAATALSTYQSNDPDQWKWYIEHARLALEAALAGRVVVDLPQPKGWRNRLTGDMHIWPIGGWSVTAEPGRVSISQSTDGLGGGMGFQPGQARQFGPALIAAADLADRLAVSPKGGETND
jgi:hypothetical protein